MGIPTDVDDLLVKATKEKRQRWSWAIVTSVGTVIATTGTVSWRVGAFLARMEHENDRLRGTILVLDKKVETLETREAASERELAAAIHDARTQADKALLYAQLTGQKVGVVLP